MKKIVIFILISLLIGCSTKKEEIVEIPKYDDIVIKASWFSFVDFRDNMQNKSEEDFSSEVENIINTLDEGGFNTIYVHAVSFTDAFYDSNIYPRTLILPNIEYDPLNIFIEKAHKKGIRVEAWINPMRSYLEEELIYVDDDFIVKKWINDEKPYIKNVKGRYYLNPAYEEVNNLILSVIDELITNYDIDGIHMDDYFYPDGVTEDFDYEVYSERCLNKCSLKEFRTSNVNNLVALINKKVKKANLVFGISPSGNMSYSIDTIYGNFYDWVDARIVDYLIPQIYWGYKHPTKPYLKTLEEWMEVVKGSDVDLIVGLAGYKIGVEDVYAKEGKFEWIENNDIISKQIQDAKELKVKGISIFSYQSIYKPIKEVEKAVELEREKFEEKLLRWK